MGDAGLGTKIHVAQGVPWIEAIINLLEPRSPHHPWRFSGRIAAGDGLIGLLDTDPVSVVAAVGVVGPGGPCEAALAAGVDSSTPLLELGTLASLTSTGIRNEGGNVTLGNADGLITLLGDGQSARDDPQYLNGHTTLAAARVLLASGGRCTGCERRLDLTRANARYRLHIHTVAVDPALPDMPVALDLPEEASVNGYGPEFIPAPGRFRPLRLPPDWPAVLCDVCHDRMRLSACNGFLDFKFSLHPRCPACSAAWTMRTMAGFVAVTPNEPWIRHTGCTPGQRWWCGACGFRWGGQWEPGGST